MYKGYLKKSLAITLAVAGVQVNTGYAQTNEIKCTPTVNGRNVVCSVELPEIKGNGAVLMVVAKGDTDIQPSEVYAIELITEEKPDPITFVMPENATGDANQQYSIVIKNGSDAEKSFDFQYVHPEIVSQIISTLKITVRDNIDAFMSGTTQGILNTSGLKSAGVYTDIYAGITQNQSAVWDIYYSNAEKFAEMTDIELIAWLNNGIISGALNETGADVSKLLSLLNKSFAGVEYVKMPDSQKQWTNQYVSANLPISLSNKIEDVFEKANIVYAFNNARYSDIDTLISNYGSKVGIMASSHYTTYCSFSQDKKTKTQENMVIAFGKMPVNTISGIVPVFEAAVQDAKSFQGSGNTGGSGGGGGGGAGGSGGSGSSAGSGIPDGKGGLDVTSTTNILQPAKPFADLGSVNWAEEAIVALNKKNVISGMGDGKFCPQESVTREQMVKMILLASGFSATEVDSGFEDVIPGAWYAPYVGNAVKQGIVAGIDSTHFGVGQNITRQDAAVMINRAMKIINKTKSNVRSYIDFADKAEIADYAEEAIKNLYVTGVISGKENHTFAPKATCTRAEAAKMIYDAFIK